MYFDCNHDYHQRVDGRYGWENQVVYYSQTIGNAQDFGSDPQRWVFRGGWQGTKACAGPNGTRSQTGIEFSRTPTGQPEPYQDMEYSICHRDTDVFNGFLAPAGYQKWFLITGDRFIHWWIFPTNFNSKQTILSNGYYDADTEGTHFTIDTDGTLEIRGGDDTATETHNTTQVFVAGQWNLLVMGHDADNKNFETSINNGTIEVWNHSLVWDYYDSTNYTHPSVCNLKNSVIDQYFNEGSKFFQFVQGDNRKTQAEINAIWNGGNGLTTPEYFGEKYTYFPSSNRLNEEPCTWFDLSHRWCLFGGSPPPANDLNILDGEIGGGLSGMDTLWSGGAMAPSIYNHGEYWQVPKWNSGTTDRGINGRGNVTFVYNPDEPPPTPTGGTQEQAYSSYGMGVNFSTRTIEETEVPNVGYVLHYVTDHTIFLVLSRSEYMAIPGCLFSFWAGNNRQPSCNSPRYLLREDGALGWKIGSGYPAVDNNTEIHYGTAVGAPAVDEVFVCAFRMNGRAITYWINGVKVGGTSTSWGSAESYPGVNGQEGDWPIRHLGNDDGCLVCGNGAGKWTSEILQPYSADVEPFYGVLAEFVAYRTALSTSHMANIMSDLMKKWGIPK